MRDFFKLKFSIPLILLAGIYGHAESGQPFEGVLSYQLSTSGRDWEVRHQVKGTSTRTDISLKGLLFQSILDLDGEIYLLDVMSKKIIPPMRGSGDVPPPEEQSVEEKDEVPPPAFDRQMPAQAPAEIVEEKIVWEHPGKSFGIVANERTATLLGMEGFGTIPSAFFMQFRELQDFAANVVATLQFYNLVPVKIRVDGKGKNKLLKMELISVDPSNLDPSVFELPSGYSLVVMPGRGGPGGSSGTGQKKGSPSGGGGRPPQGGEPPGGGSGRP